jgi:hypothetical protein
LDTCLCLHAEEVLFFRAVPCFELDLNSIERSA